MSIAFARTLTSRGLKDTNHGPHAACQFTLYDPLAHLIAIIECGLHQRCIISWFKIFSVMALNIHKHFLSLDVNIQHISGKSAKQ